MRRPGAAAARIAAVAAAICAGGVAGCAGVEFPDLFLVTRSGSIPGARLTLLVNDGGTVRCNGSRPRLLPSAQLIQARVLARAIAPDARSFLRLPRLSGSVLSYRVRSKDGTVSFSDDSPAQPPELRRLAAFVRAVARGTCGLAR